MKTPANWRIPVFIALGLALIAMALVLPDAPILPRCDADISVTMSVLASSCTCVQVVTACPGVTE